jgi:hypothetical protein
MLPVLPGESMQVEMSWLEVERGKLPVYGIGMDENSRILNRVAHALRFGSSCGASMASQVTSLLIPYHAHSARRR